MPTSLTVDDAPSGTLPAKLDALAERGITVVLFCEGRRLDEHPEHAVRAIEAGHVLGNHTYSHGHAAELDVSTFRAEVERTERLLAAAYDAAGVERPAKLFRFPFGDRGGEREADFQSVLAEHGFVGPDASALTGYDGDGRRDWGWTVSVEDWEVETPAALRANVAAVAERFDDPGTLVLFHDGGNDPALFASFLDDVGERGVAFADPLDLL